MHSCARVPVRVCACVCACSSRRHRGRLCPRRQAAAGGPVMFVLARARACACAHRRHRGRRRRTCAPDAAVRPSGRWPPQDLPPAVPLPLPLPLPYPRTPPVPILGSLYDIVLYSFGPKRISRPPSPSLISPPLSLSLSVSVALKYGLLDSPEIARISALYIATKAHCSIGT